MPVGRWLAAVVDFGAGPHARDPCRQSMGNHTPSPSRFRGGHVTLETSEARRNGVWGKYFMKRGDPCPIRHCRRRIVAETIKFLAKFAFSRTGPKGLLLLLYSFPPFIVSFFSLSVSFPFFFPSPLLPFPPPFFLSFLSFIPLFFFPSVLLFSFPPPCFLSSMFPPFFFSTPHVHCPLQCLPTPLPPSPMAEKRTWVLEFAHSCVFYDCSEACLPSEDTNLRRISR